MQSLYSVLIDPEYVEMCNDICHKWVLLTVYQSLMSMTNGTELLSDTFVDGMCFLTIGMVVYWVLFRKVIQFQSDEP